MQSLDNPAKDREIGRRSDAGDASTQDSTRTDDTRIGAVRPLISPALLLDELPPPDSSLQPGRAGAPRHQRCAARP